MTTVLQLRHRRNLGGAGQMVLPLTPLIDISLMLAVLLIAVMDSQEHDQQLPVQLPAAATAQPAQPGFVVTLDAEGVVHLGGRSVSSADLLAAAKGQGAAIIRADAQVAHRLVVGVVDILRQAGVQRIVYGTESGVVEW
jgi:biopolymer transport protein TolR